MFFERLGKSREKQPEKKERVAEISETKGKEREKIDEMSAEQRITYNLWEKKNPECPYSEWEEFWQKLIEKFYSPELRASISRWEELTKGPSSEMRRDTAGKEEIRELTVKIAEGKKKEKDAEAKLKDELRRIFDAYPRSEPITASLTTLEIGLGIAANKYKSESKNTEAEE